MLFAMVLGGLSLTACSEDDLDTQQFLGQTSLNAFGPCPVARGGQLRFIGTNMNTVTAVVFPGGAEVTDITKISDREIQVIVPQTAEVGNIVLKTPAGEITSKAQISYSEPISIEGFSPAKVKAGEVLTITGEYLNLMNAVVFAEGDTVKVLKSHSRKEIQVVVPATAQTGKIAISDCAEQPQVIESETDLVVVLPAVAAIVDLSDKKPGEVITLDGSDFDLVEDVQVAGVSVDFEIIEDKSIVFALPENTPATAEVVVVPASGVKVVVAQIGMSLPTELVATPNSKVWAGDKIVITGKNLDVVADVTFPGVGDAVIPEEQSATSLTVVMPEGAQSGEVLLNCKSGLSVSLAIETLKPTRLSINPNPAPANSEITIKGVNLHNVVKVEFSGVNAVEVSPSADGKEIKVVVPTMAESGIVKLLLSNGEVVEAKELEVTKPECAYVVDPSLLVSTDENEIKAGDIVVVEINNADLLTSVLIDGNECQYILNGKVLYVLTPTSAGKSSVLKLVSSNGEIEYALSVVPNGEVVTVLWSGMGELAWSGEGQIYMGDDGGQSLIDAGAKAGDRIRIKFTPTADDWCFQLWEGHWGTMYGQWGAPGTDNEPYDLAGNGNCFYFELTDEMIANATTVQGWGGIFLVQGQSLVVTEMALIQGTSAEVTLWEGELIADDWSNQPYALSDAGLELIDAGAKAGQTVNFYLTPIEPGWKLELLEGHWGPSYAAWCAPGEDTENGKFTEWDLSANGGKVSIKLTQEMLDAAFVQQWWGGVFVLNGDNVKCTKITLE